MAEELYKQYDKPWGFYKPIHYRPYTAATETTPVQPATKTKLLCIQPGQAISLQTHTQRDEHWIIVAGPAQVTTGTTVRNYGTGSHIFVNKLKVHRIANISAWPIYLIEVQLGEYVGEDDITRLDDMYGR